MLWWILLIVSSIYLYIKLIRPLSYWRKRNVPYEKSWPFVGNIGGALFRYTSFAQLVERFYYQYPNSFVGILQFTAPTLIITDVELIKQITVKDFDHFLNHQFIVSEEVDPLFGKNLFALQGQRWRNMRTTLSPAFTGSKMRAMIGLMSECAEDFTKYFLKYTNKHTPLTLDMYDTFTRLANDVIASTAFGIKCDSFNEKNNQFYLMGKKASNFDGIIMNLKFLGKTVCPWMMKMLNIKLFDEDVCEFFRHIVMSNMKTREEQGIVRPDMINLLMQARKGQLKDDDPSKFDKDAGFATVEEAKRIGEEKQTELSDDDLVAQALLFFIAGFGSASTLLCHIANELAVNPSIQKKLQDEIDKSLAEADGKVTYDMVTQMKYMDMVISETLRKWPPSPAGDRICTKPFVLKPSDPNVEPLQLRKDDLLWFPIYALQRDPKYFPEPDKFVPERFSDENKKNIKPFSYLPFGLGPRNCIGSRYALLEAKVVFVHLLSKFDLVVVEKTQVPLQISRSSFMLLAEKGFWLGLKLRN